jgi:hypothetical protein
MCEVQERCAEVFELSTMVQNMLLYAFKYYLGVVVVTGQVGKEIAEANDNRT